LHNLLAVINNLALNVVAEAVFTELEAPLPYSEVPVGALTVMVL
jgi:hypothetical protein